MFIIKRAVAYLVPESVVFLGWPSLHYYYWDLWSALVCFPGKQNCSPMICHDSRQLFSVASVPSAAATSGTFPWRHARQYLIAFFAMLLLLFATNPSKSLSSKCTSHVSMKHFSRNVRTYSSLLSHLFLHRHVPPPPRTTQSVSTLNWLLKKPNPSSFTCVLNNCRFWLSHPFHLSCIGFQNENTPTPFQFIL